MRTQGFLKQKIIESGYNALWHIIFSLWFQQKNLLLWQGEQITSLTLSPPTRKYELMYIDFEFIIGTESVIEFMQIKRMILIIDKISLWYFCKKWFYLYSVMLCVLKIDISLSNAFCLIHYVDYWIGISWNTFPVFTINRTAAR